MKSGSIQSDPKCSDHFSTLKLHLNDFPRATPLPRINCSSDSASTLCTATARLSRFVTNESFCEDADDGRARGKRLSPVARANDVHADGRETTLTLVLTSSKTKQFARNDLMSPDLVGAAKPADERSEILDFFLLHTGSAAQSNETLMCLRGVRPGGGRRRSDSASAGCGSAPTE